MIARGLRRWLGYALQIREDFAWHQRFNSADMPHRMARVVEQARLLISNAIDGEDYYNHALFRADMCAATKRQFLGYFEKWRYFDTINPPVYDILARDKVLFHMLATSLGVPVPQLIAVTGEAGQPAFGRRLTDLNALAAYLMESDSQDIFLKPVGGSFGQGALSLGEKRLDGSGWTHLPGQGTIHLSEVLQHVRRGDKLGRFLIQRRLRPHPLLAEIVPDVCSTVRFMTYFRTSPMLLGAALRLGSGREPTDNLTGGGVVVSIDPQTGRLGDVVSIDRGVPERSTIHPVTHVQVSGKYLPDWLSSVELVKVMAEKFSFLPCIGWDVAITDQGPVIVEINTRPRCRSIQVANDKGMLVDVFREALIEHDGTLRSGLHLRG